MVDRGISEHIRDWLAVKAVRGHYLPVRRGQRARPPRQQTDYIADHPSGLVFGKAILYDCGVFFENSVWWNTGRESHDASRPLHHPDCTSAPGSVAQPGFPDEPARVELD
jgi:hypothetical protein